MAYCSHRRIYGSATRSSPLKLWTPLPPEIPSVDISWQRSAETFRSRRPSEKRPQHPPSPSLAPMQRLPSLSMKRWRFSCVPSERSVCTRSSEHAQTVACHLVCHNFRGACLYSDMLPLIKAELRVSVIYKRSGRASNHRPGLWAPLLHGFLPPGSVSFPPALCSPVRLLSMFPQ